MSARSRLRRLLGRCECCGARAEFPARQFNRNWCSECKFAVHPTCECSRCETYSNSFADWNSDEDAIYDEPPWDADDLPSTADPGVVTDPKEEP